MKKHPKKKRKSDYQNRIYMAVLGYLWTGTHKPHRLKLRDTWLGDIFLTKFCAWVDDSGIAREFDYTELEFHLRGEPHMLSRVPTECFRHRFYETVQLIRKIQRENENIYRDYRKKSWEWIGRLTEQWLAELAQHALSHNAKLRASHGESKAA